MSRGAFVLFALTLLLVGPRSWADESLLGHWTFQSVLYRGHELPRPNPLLNLTFEFRSDGTNILRWSRQDERGACERTAHYQALDGFLDQIVVGVSPENRSDCAADPDMQNGNRSRTPYRLRNDRLELEFNLGEEIIVYVWERSLGLYLK